jgi:hypothetical protein
MARKLGVQLLLAGYAVMTGGGPGIIAAVNQGARRGSTMQNYYRFLLSDRIGWNTQERFVFPPDILSPFLAQ